MLRIDDALDPGVDFADQFLLDVGIRVTQCRVDVVAVRQVRTHPAPDAKNANVRGPLRMLLEHERSRVQEDLLLIRDGHAGLRLGMATARDK